MKKLSRKERIIEVAIEILAEKNFQNMTTAEIARKAEVAEGTIYRHFKNKQALFIEVLHVITEKMNISIIDEAHFGDTLHDTMKLIAEVFLSAENSMLHYYRIFYKSFSEIEDENIRVTLQSMYQKSLSRLSGFLAKMLKHYHIPFQKESLRTSSVIIWGIGDMIWKERILFEKENLKPFDEDFFEEVIEKIAALLRF